MGILARLDFKLCEDIIEHRYLSQNIISLLSQFGGLAFLIVNFFSWLGSWINNDLLTYKFMKNLYYVTKSESSLNNFHGKHMLDALSKIPASPTKDLKRKDFNKITKLAKKRVQEDTSVVKIIQSINKLQAATSVLINNDYRVCSQIHEQYLK